MRAQSVHVLGFPQAQKEIGEDSARLQKSSPVYVGAGIAGATN
jgi:hypothetical protein